MKKAVVKILRGDKWKLKNDLVLRKGKVYVLRDEKLRIEVIQLYHNVPVERNRRQQS